MASPQPGWSPLNAPGDRWVPLDAPIITHNGVQGWFVTADMQVPQAFIQQVQMLALERAGMVELTVHPNGQITGVVPSSSSSSSSGSARSRALRSVDSWGEHDPVDPDYVHLGQVYRNPTAEELAEFRTNALLRETTRWGPTAAHGAAEDSREAAVAALSVPRELDHEASSSEGAHNWSDSAHGASWDSRDSPNASNHRRTRKWEDGNGSASKRKRENDSSSDEDQAA